VDGLKTWHAEHIIRGVHSIEAWTQPAFWKKTGRQKTMHIFREVWEERLKGPIRNAFNSVQYLSGVIKMQVHSSSKFPIHDSLAVYAALKAQIASHSS